MSVPEQMPIVEYTANGATTRFPITFDLHDVGYLNVFINKELIQIGSYTVENFEAVIFGTAPKDGDEITLIRDTQLDRETNYQTYDNSFRPTAVNYDFDKIWHVLQEQNLIDGKILARLKAEIEWRRTHDFNYDELAQVREKQLFDALKGYTDTLVAAVNPGIFQGVIAGVVFAQDGKSIQTHIEDILKQLEVGSSSVTAETARAEVAEQLLGQKITTEENRARSAEANLQLQISTTANGIKYFETEVALKAFTPTEVDPQQAYAFDTKKNYLWNGSEWKDEGKSVLDQAKDYTNQSIDSIFDADINLFEPKDYEVGKYYDYKTGVKTVAANQFLASKLIRIEPNTEYQVPTYDNQQKAFFDKDGRFISGLATVNQTTFKFTTPSNAKFIGITLLVNWLDTFMLCEASKYPSTYTPFAVKKKALKVDLDQVAWPEDKFDLTVQKIAHLHDINLIDHNKVLDGRYVSYSTGEVFPNSAFVATDFIEIQGVTEYQNTAGNNQQSAFYDENKVYISGLATTAPTDKFVTPANAKYIRLTIHKTLLDRFMLTTSEEFESEYIPFGVKSLKNVRVDSNGSGSDDANSTPIFQPVLKAISSGLNVNLTGTVIKQADKSTVLASVFMLDATTVATATKDSTLNKSGAKFWISNPNEFLGFCNISNVVVTNKANDTTLTSGVHYEVDSFGGKLIGLTDTVYNVSVSFTHTMQRYDLIQINPFTLAVSVKKGVERTQDPSEWMVEVDAPCRALCRVLVTGTKIEIVPLDEYISSGGKPYVSKPEFDALRLHNQSCLKRIFAKLNKGQNISLVGYGDSITAMGGYHTEDIPNENHDWYGFFATLPQDTQTAKVPTFNYEGGGGGRMHTGWNWALKDHLERTYSNEVMYWNYGVSGTDSADGARDQRLAYPLSKNPDLVVVAFGMNDAGSSDLYTNLVKIVNTFKNAGADVVLMPVVRTPTLPFVNYQGEAWRQVNRFVYSAAIDSGAAYCPIDWYVDDAHYGGMGVSPKHFCIQNMFNHPGPYEYSIYGKILIGVFE